MRIVRHVSAEYFRLISCSIHRILRNQAMIEINFSPVSHDKHRISISVLKISPDLGNPQVKCKQCGQYLLPVQNRIHILLRRGDPVHVSVLSISLWMLGCLPCGAVWMQVIHRTTNIVFADVEPDLIRWRFCIASSAADAFASAQSRRRSGGKHGQSDEFFRIIY